MQATDLYPCDVAVTPCSSKNIYTAYHMPSNGNLTKLQILTTYIRIVKRAKNN